MEHLERLLEQEFEDLESSTVEEEAFPCATPLRSRFGLSGRETEILALGSQGLSDKEIVDRLGISMPTLRTLWNRVRVKLGAVNRTHAIVLAAQGQSIPADDGVSTLQRIAGELTRDRVSSWVWQGRRREVLMDDLARRLFCLPPGKDPIPTERVLAHVWSPDRGRFERFISQAGDLRPMTPIELRVGNPGEYYNLIRTVNVACQTGLDGTVVLFASTVLHVFTP